MRLMDGTSLLFCSSWVALRIMANLSYPFQARVTAGRSAAPIVVYQHSQHRTQRGSVVAWAFAIPININVLNGLPPSVLTAAAFGFLELPAVTIIGLDCSFPFSIHIPLDQPTPQPQSCLQEWAVSIRSSRSFFYG